MMRIWTVFVFALSYRARWVLSQEDNDALNACRNNLSQLEQERQLAFDQVKELQEALEQERQAATVAKESHEECQASLTTAASDSTTALHAQVELSREEVKQLLETLKNVEAERQGVQEELKQVKAALEEAQQQSAGAAPEERAAWEEERKSFQTQVEQLESENKELRERYDSQVDKLQKDYEQKLERMWKKEGNKHDALMEKLRVAQEQFAATKETLFETRRELHQANHELRFQRQITDTIKSVEKRMWKLYQDDPLGVVAFYKNKVHPVLQQIAVVVGPIAIQVKDFTVSTTIFIAQQAAHHWTTTVQPFLIMVGKEYVVPNAVKAWDATSEHRAWADEKLQSLLSQVVSHPFWQKYPQIAQGQEWLTEKTCFGTDVLSSYIKMHLADRTNRNGWPELIIESSEFVHAHCENVVVVMEGLLVTLLMMSLTSWLLSLTTLSSSKSKSKKMTTANGKLHQNPQSPPPADTKAAQRRKIRAKLS